MFAEEFERAFARELRGGLVVGPAFVAVEAVVGVVEEDLVFRVTGGELANAVAVSLTRIFAGFLMGGVPALLLGLVLGPQMEEYFRRAMLLSRGDPAVFIERPISLGLLITTTLLLILMALPSIKKARKEAFQEEG